MLTADERASFFERGWLHVPSAFSPDDAAAIREITWEAMARQDGIVREDRRTWTCEAPAHLDHLKGRPELRAVASERTNRAISDVLGDARWKAGKGWGANFVLFPTDRPFDVAAGTWHIDSPYELVADPLAAVQVITLYGDVAPRAGGMQIIEGSHRAFAQWASTTEVPDKAARARRAFLRSDPWFVDLCTAADAASRVQRFMVDGGSVSGVPVRVVELAGGAGDLFLVHPHTFHCRPTNAGDAPRFMLSTFARRVGT